MFNFQQSNYKFTGNKRRTKEQLQSLMYFAEMDEWLAHEKLDEARTQARLMEALIRHDAEESPNSVPREQNGVMASGIPSHANFGEIVVEDEDDEIHCQDLGI